MATTSTPFSIYKVFIATFVMIGVICFIAGAALTEQWKPTIYYACLSFCVEFFGKKLTYFFCAEVLLPTFFFLFLHSRAQILPLLAPKPTSVSVPKLAFPIGTKFSVDLLATSGLLPTNVTGQVNHKINNLLLKKKEQRSHRTLGN